MAESRDNSYAAASGANDEFSLWIGNALEGDESLSARSLANLRNLLETATELATERSRTAEANSQKIMMEENDHVHESIRQLNGNIVQVMDKYRERMTTSGIADDSDKESEAESLLELDRLSTPSNKHAPVKQHSDDSALSQHSSSLESELSVMKLHLQDILLKTFLPLKILIGKN